MSNRRPAPGTAVVCPGRRAPKYVRVRIHMRVRAQKTFFRVLAGGCMSVVLEHVGLVD